MPLFLDGNISTVEDLRVYDSNILHLANIEGVELGGKLLLAQQELETEIKAHLAREAAGGEPEMPPSVVDLGRLVVTPPLKQWHSLRTLAIVYRDVYFSQLNDRYQGRWQEFMKLDRAAATLLFETGLGMVNNPVPQAAAPEIVLGDGVMPSAAYYVRVAWINGDGQEGRPSATTAVIAPESHALVVRAVAPPPAAAGWHIWVGTSEGALARQNAAPVASGDAWSLPDTGLRAGAAPGDGQMPDYYFRPAPLFRRG